MSKTLYVSDLDGTLLGADSRISAESAALINSVIAEGALFTIATARTPATVSGILCGIDMRLPAIVMTGATLWNPADGKYSHTVFMDPAAVAPLLEAFEANRVPALIYTLRHSAIHVYRRGVLNEVERQFQREREHTDLKIFHTDRADGVFDISMADRVLLVFSISPDEEAHRVYDRIRGMKEISPLCYHDIFGDTQSVTEAFPARATKAEAIAKLKKLTGADRIVAFGDNVNDLPMLRCADVAVAVENAVAEVKEAADIVIGPNTADSVARFIAADFRSHPHGTSPSLNS